MRFNEEKERGQRVHPSHWISERWETFLISLVGRLRPVAPLQSRRGRWFPRRPVRKIELVTGEICFSELLAVAQRTIEFRTEWGMRAKIPRKYVQSISNAPGWSSVVTHFAPLDPKEEIRELSEDVSSGRLQVFCREMPLSAIDSRSNLELIFSERPQQIFRLTHAPGRPGMVSLPAEWVCAYRQPLAWRFDEPICLNWTANTWSLLQGRRVWMEGKKPADSLKGWRVAQDTPESPWDSLLIERYDEPFTHGLPQTDDQDVLFVVDGSELHGTLISIDDVGIHWQFNGDDRPITIFWPMFSRLSFASASSVPSPPLEGAIARVRGPIHFRHRSQTTLIAAIERAPSSAETLFQFRHPFFTGPIPLPENFECHEIQNGYWQWLWPGQTHLGDEIRTDLAPVIPREPPLKGRWEWESIPPHEWNIVAEIAEMEPCGPGTVTTQPFLSLLRRNELLTEFWLNGQRVAAWNDFINWKAPVIAPQTVKIPVPRTLFRAGENQWEIRQGRHPVFGLDDLQLQSIRLQSRF